MSDFLLALVTGAAGGIAVVAAVFGAAWWVLGWVDKADEEREE